MQDYLIKMNLSFDVYFKATMENLQLSDITADF